jgi:phage tail tube protein FII
MSGDLKTYEGFNLFCQNVDKGLNLKTLKAGGFKEKTENFRPGFSDMGIELGMGVEAFVFEFNLTGDDPETLALFGFGAGTVQNFTAYKASKSRFSNDTTAKQTIIHVRGRILEADEDDMEGGKLVGTKFKVGEIRAFKQVHEGVLLQHYDITGGGNLLNRSDVMRALGR